MHANDFLSQTAAFIDPCLKSQSPPFTAPMESSPKTPLHAIAAIIPRYAFRRMVMGRFPLVKSLF